MSEIPQPYGQETTEFQAPQTDEELGSEPEKSAEIGQILRREFSSGQLPEAVFVVSGDIVPDSVERTDRDTGYKSPSYAELDPKGLISGGKARVIAAAEIAKAFPDVTVVTTSRGRPDQPTHAEVMAQELTVRDVDPSQIVLEQASTNTLTELIEMVKLTVDQDWQRVDLLTSDYHITRCQAMLSRLRDLTVNDPDFLRTLDEFERKQVEVVFTAAEEVLEKVNSKFKYLIDQVKQSEAYQKRLAAERQGLEDLETGRYKPTEI